MEKIPANNVEPIPGRHQILLHVPVRRSTRPDGGGGFADARGWRNRWSFDEDLEGSRIAGRLQPCPNRSKTLLLVRGPTQIWRLPTRWFRPRPRAIRVLAGQSTPHPGCLPLPSIHWPMCTLTGPLTDQYIFGMNKNG
jgi:hypothetical protein